MIRWTKRAVVLAVAAGAICLVACDATSLSADPQVIADTDAAFQELTAGNEKALLTRLPKEVAQDPGQVRMIGLMRQLLPEAKADPYQLVGWRTYAGTDGRQHTAVLRYAYGNGEHITASTVFRKPENDGPWRIENFNINPSTPEEVAAPTVATSLVGGRGGNSKE